MSLYHQSSGPTVILASSAAVSVIQFSISHYVNTISPSTSCVATAADGNNLRLCGQGDLGPVSSVLTFDIIRHNSSFVI